MGAPPTLLALLLLLLNDRVWKEQWPGLVTGKLSDFAGLVVAPPLLALALSVCRVTRPAAWALGATAIGFAVVKATTAGAEFATAAWSLVMPSSVLRDPTDLVALPALWAAWRTWRWAARPEPTRNRRAILALGSLALPLAVFATAATSCSPATGLDEVTVYEGVFTSGTGATEQRIVSGSYSSVTIDPAGQLQVLGNLDSYRLVHDGRRMTTQVCSTAAPRLCWRRAPDRTAAVDASTDGGATWQTEFALGQQELKAVREDLGDDQCGGRPPLGVVDLAVLDSPAGQVVAAAASNSGLLLRSTSGEWRRLPLDDIDDIAQSPPTPDPGQQLYPVEPAPSPTGPTRSPTGTLGPVPTRTCAVPVTRTYTPDPRNGPPVTVTRCP
ncbi:MAG: hypothetical protein ABIO48_00550 [Pedococcus sp.]